MDNGNFDNIVLALLFSADEPLSVRKLTSILEHVPAEEIKEGIDRLRKRFDDETWSIVLERVAGGYQLSSRPEYAKYIARLYSGRRKLRLSRAALETLAIVAYKQPITRAEIENLRGVGCGSVVSNLMERTLVRITGKAKVLGAPFLYGTTQEFLEYLGLNSLKDLPSLEELEALLEREEAAVAEAASPLAAAESEELVAEAEVEPDEEAVGNMAVGFADHEPEQEHPLDTPLSDLEVSPDEAVSPMAVSPTADEPAAAPEEAPAAARIGPEIEEPYHRPLGDPGDDPIWTESDPEESPASSDESESDDPERDDPSNNRDG